MRWGTATIVSSASMTANVFSSGINLEQEWVGSVQAVWTGSALGTLKLQMSNDNVVTAGSGSNPAANVTNWTDINGTLSSTSGTAGTSSFYWNVTDPGFRWTRLTYTSASGSGILSANFFGKSP